MGDFTTETFAQRALSLNLVPQKELQSIWQHLGTRDVELDSLVKLMERRGLLTNWQVERIFKGEQAGFFYGDYKVLYFVGKGTFARVYRAVHKDTGQVVALKVLRSKQSKEKKDRDRFMREGEMGLKLRHPNIVPIYETYSKGSVHFFAMEFIEGQSLLEFLKLRRKIEPLEATEIMDGVVSGVSHAFEKGVCHRDLKLSNILISSNGLPKLVDFGLANMETEGGVKGYTNTRTIDYANLEKLSNVEKGDRRSDIFFVGCMYYNLLAGVPAHEDTRDRAKRAEHSRLKNVISIRQHLPEIPREVESIVNKSMSIDASRRYQKPVEMLVEVRKCIKTLKAAAGGDVVEQKVLEGEGKTLMLIESTAKMQDILRGKMKKQGYRILVIGDAERGYQRVAKDPKVADCVIVSTISLGRDGASVFQKLASEPKTAHLPMILLVGKKQEKLLKKIELAEHHRSAIMPINITELRQLLRELLDGAKKKA